MQSRSWFGLIAVAAACGLGAPIRAERPPEQQSAADIVVTGTVEGLYQRSKGDYVNYVVELRVESVDKGKDLAKGATVYVYCFNRKPNAPQIPSASGHAIPQEGERIKAFFKDGQGKHEAIYPYWFEELKKPATK